MVKLEQGNYYYTKSLFNIGLSTTWIDIGDFRDCIFPLFRDSP